MSDTRPVTEPVQGRQITIEFEGLEPIKAGPVDITLSVAERFWRFHGLNPHVLSALHSLAMQQVRAGRRVLSIDDLTCVLRYASSVVTEGEVFKMPNDFRPFYARLLADVYPALRGLIEERRMFRNEYAPPAELGIDSSWRNPKVLV